MEPRTRRSVGYSMIARPAGRARRGDGDGPGVVSMPQAVGMRVLESLFVRGIRHGPVLADIRGGTCRLGFLVPGSDSADHAALSNWVRRTGWSYGVRFSPHRGPVLLQIVLRAPQGRLRWVIPPDAEAAAFWSVQGLLSALADAATDPHTARWRW